MRIAAQYLRPRDISGGGTDRRSAAVAENAGTVGGVIVPDQIICVECQGTCHLLSQRPADDPFMPGDFVAYRCPDCLERFDLVLEADDDEIGSGPALD